MIQTFLYVYTHIYKYRLTKLSFKVDDFGKIKTHVNFWEDILLESSYEIEPQEALIQPYSTQTFRVTLNKTGTYMCH
jgi:hypothetical protein